MADDGQDFVIKVTTDLQQASRGLDGLMKQIESMTSSGGERFGLLDKAIGGIGGTVVATVARFNGWLKAAQALLVTLDKVLEFGGKIATAFGLDETWEELTSAISELGETVSGAFEEISKSATDFASTSADAAGGAEHLTTAMEAITEKATAAVRVVQAFFATLQSLDSRSESALKAQIDQITSELEAKRQQFAESMGDGMIGSINRALGFDQKLLGGIYELEVELARLQERLTEVQKAADTVDFANIAPGLEIAIQGLQKTNRELEIQIHTFGMAAGAAARYRAEQELLLKLGDEDGLPRHDRTNQLRAELEEGERNTQRLEDMRKAKRDAEREEQRDRAAGERTERIFTSGEGRVEQITAQARALTLQAGAAAELAAQERTLLQLRQANIPITDELTARIEALARAEGQAAENLRTMQRQMQLMTDVGRTFGTAMERAFSDWITGAETDWNRLFASLMRDLALLALRQAVIQPLLGGGAGGGGGLLGSLLSGLLPGRATGGPVQAGRPYMVGEQGPEPFIPSTDGFILPSGAMQGGGNGTVEMNMTINLEGANGDETISRIAGAAARRAAAQAVEQANASFPARQRRFHLLGD